MRLTFVTELLRAAEAMLALAATLSLAHVAAAQIYIVKEDAPIEALESPLPRRPKLAYGR